MQSEEATTKDPLFSVPNVALKPRARLVPAADLKIWQTASETVKGLEHLCEETKIRAAKDHEAERKRGFEEGYNEGARKAAEIHLETEQRASEFLNQMRSDLPNIVETTLKEILGKFDASDLMLKAIKNAVSKHGKSLNLSLRVPDKFIQYLSEDITSEERQSLSEIQIEIDHSLDDGQCVLQSDLGVVNLGLEDQLAQVKAHLSSRAARHGNG